VHDVLVIDDDSAIRDTLQDALTYEGYEVAAVANGLEALGYLARQRRTPPRLILLDIMMPVMDGIEFLESYAADPLFPGVPIVVMSAHVDGAAVLRRNWVVLHMNKPFDLDDLCNVVEHWCAPERPPLSAAG
jgi:CheY-like chemotaxis protein